MDKLSNLEFVRLYEILQNIADVIQADDVGITWGLEDDVNEAVMMVSKAVK